MSPKQVQLDYVDSLTLRYLAKVLGFHYIFSARVSPVWDMGHRGERQGQERCRRNYKSPSERIYGELGAKASDISGAEIQACTFFLLRNMLNIVILK